MIWGHGGNKAGEKKWYSSIPLRKKDILLNLMNLKFEFWYKLGTKEWTAKCFQSVLRLRSVHDLSHGYGWIIYNPLWFEQNTGLSTAPEDLLRMANMGESDIYRHSRSKYIAPYHQPGTRISIGNRATGKLDTVLSTLNSALPHVESPSPENKWYVGAACSREAYSRMLWTEDEMTPIDSRVT